MLKNVKGDKLNAIPSADEESNEDQQKKQRKESFNQQIDLALIAKQQN